MKKLTSKSKIQKIIIVIIIVMSFNFIAPTYSRANFGGVLAGPIIDFFSGVCDAVLSALQYFMYDGEITRLNTAAGAVGGALKIINPWDSFMLMVDTSGIGGIGNAADAIEDAASEIASGTAGTSFEDKLKKYDVYVEDSVEEDIEIDADEFDKGWVGSVFGIFEKGYGIPIIKYTPEKIFANKVPALDANFINPKVWKVENDADPDEATEQTENMNNHSITQQLHSTIANWYVALRNFAIVALLSVLLYVGIRMIISSTAADKSKYKEMLMQWLVALCILFFLHYIMSFILTVTEMITDGIAASSSEIVVKVTDGDKSFKFRTDLTGLCRLQIQYSDLGARMIYLIFYIALVVYTVMFTWVYVKRAITMAFLTLMAPVVAITYPIDKIGDGKAQAFGIWLKEFMFNALLQPFHLIIFTVFLGASSEIAVRNPIYAILFLAFIIPAEKLLRKMFGFDKASTAGGMSTAASIFGGAAVLKGANNLIGKIGGKAGAGKAGVRTKNTAITDSNAPSKVKDMADTLGGTKMQELPDDSVDSGKEKHTDMPDGDETHSAESKPQLSQQTQARNRSLRDNFAWKKDDKGNNIDNRGIGQWLGDGIGQTLRDGKNAIGQKFDQKFGNKKFVRTVKQGNKRIKDMAGRVKKAYNSSNPIANTIRGVVGVTGKAAVNTAKFAGKAAIGGTIGLAAGIAGDDLEDVAKFGLAGATLGVAGLPILGRGISNAANSMRSTYETEAFGYEAATLKEQDRQQMKNDEYRQAMDSLFEEIHGNEPTASESRAFAKEGLDYYNAGMTDTKEIRKSVKFEKDLQKQLKDDGATEEDASAMAKKQAMIISKLTKDVDKKDLINESKRDSWKNQFYNQLKDTGMNKKEAEAGANYVIKLLMKRHGLSPD